MQRYFAIDKNLNLNKQDIFHIIKVMRMNMGDEIQIVYEKRIFLCKITDISNNNVEFSIEKELEENNEFEKEITIAFSLVNETKTDFILQKCTELGATSFIPINTKRCKIKIDNKQEKKITRWNTITKEAAEQSFRNLCPKVNNIMSIKELAKLDYDLKILCSTIEKEKTIKNILQKNNNYDKIIIVVGPEGGIDEEEEKFLNENGFISTSLGSTILRTETAPMFVMSALRYEFMR